jgi:DNA invertase Pin-like site-specific DNA recombinase
MMTLKDFEKELTRLGMTDALDVLARLRGAPKRISPPRRPISRPMTPERAREVLDMHQNTIMTQCQIARVLGVNQGRVNEVIKQGKWL